VQPIYNYLQTTSNDLRSAIREGLKRRIDESRSYYQSSLIIIITASVIVKIMFRPGNLSRESE